MHEVHCILDSSQTKDLPCMRWANNCLKELPEQKIQDISNEIEKMIDSEQSKDFLTAIPCFITACVTLVIGIIGILDFGLRWLGFIFTKNIRCNRTFAISFIISFGLFSLFNRINLIRIRSKIFSEINQKYSIEFYFLESFLKDYLENRKRFEKAYNIGLDLLNIYHQTPSEIPSINKSLDALTLKLKEVTDRREILFRLHPQVKVILQPLFI